MMTNLKQARIGWILLVLSYIYVIPAQFFKEHLILWMYLSFCHIFFGGLLTMEALVRQGIKEIEDLLK